MKIPFINSTILVDEASLIDHSKELTEMERLRNLLGTEHRFLPPGKINKIDDTNSASTLPAHNNNIENHEDETVETQSHWGSALEDYVKNPRVNPNPKYSNNNSNNNNRNRNNNNNNNNNLKR